jgi:hypothetical protein
MKPFAIVTLLAALTACSDTQPAFESDVDAPFAQGSGRVAVTFDTSGLTDSTNLVVPLDVTDQPWVERVAADAADLAFTDLLGNPLPLFVESWREDSRVVWVRLPEITSITNPRYYLYVGGEPMTDAVFTNDRFVSAHLFDTIVVEGSGARVPDRTARAGQALRVGAEDQLATSLHGSGLVAGEHIAAFKDPSILPGLDRRRTYTYWLRAEGAEIIGGQTLLTPRNARTFIIGLSAPRTWRVSFLEPGGDERVSLEATLPEGVLADWIQLVVSVDFVAREVAVYANAEQLDRWDLGDVDETLTTDELFVTRSENGNEFQGLVDSFVVDSTPVDAARLRFEYEVGVGRRVTFGDFEAR